MGATGANSCIAVAPGPHSDRNGYGTSASPVGGGENGRGAHGQYGPSLRQGVVGDDGEIDRIDGPMNVHPDEHHGYDPPPLLVLQQQRDASE